MGNAINENSAAFFANQSRPSGVLSTDANLTKDQMAQLRKAWEDQSRSMNSGGVPILASGLSWESLTMSASDSEIIEQYKLTVDDVARVFSIPSMLLNNSDNVSYNNAETHMQVFLSQGLGFTVQHLELVLAHFFGLPDDAKVELDTATLLRQNFEARIKGLRDAVSGGLMSPNEARRDLGLGPVDGGEVPRLQLPNVPLDVEHWENGVDATGQATRTVRPSATPVPTLQYLFLFKNGICIGEPD